MYCTCMVFILWLFVSHRPLPHPREIALADAEMVLQEDPYFVKEGLFLSQSHREKTLPSTTLTKKGRFPPHHHRERTLPSPTNRERTLPLPNITEKALFPPSL
jgi:hypothetical protein